MSEDFEDVGADEVVATEGILPDGVMHPAKEAMSKRIRLAMAVRGVSYLDVALAVGVSRQAVWMWAMGASMPVSNRITPLAKALGCSIDWLLSSEPIDLGEGGPK